MVRASTLACRCVIELREAFLGGHRPSLARIACRERFHQPLLQNAPVACTRSSNDQAPRPGIGPSKPSNFPCFGGGSVANRARAAGVRPKLEPNRSARSAALYATPIKGLGTVISPRSLLRVITSDGSNASSCSAVFQPEPLAIH